MRPLRLLATVLLVMPALTGGVARAAAVSASAWSYETNNGQTAPNVATAAITRQAPGAPGDSRSAASATWGGLSATSQIRGCGSEYNNFQQVCNDAGSSGSYTDTLYVTADLPYNWLIQARVTLRLAGEVDGHGGYSYGTMGWVNGESRQITGTTSGTVQLVDHLSINDTRVFDTTLHVGGVVNQVWHTINTDSFQRFCAGGSADCYDSAVNWTIGVAASSSIQIEILTPGVNAHITSTSGHDYTAPAAGVGRDGAGASRLGPAWPNPARGDVQLALTLAEGANVDAGVYDLAGRRVATLNHGALEAGLHSLRWDGRDTDGRMRSGMFFVRVKGAGLDDARRVLLVR